MYTVQFIMCTGAQATSHTMQQQQQQQQQIFHVMICLNVLRVSIQKTNLLLVPGKQTQVVQTQSGILSAEKLQPGNQVVDGHFECSTRGRKFNGQGI